MQQCVEHKFVQTQETRLKGIAGLNTWRMHNHFR